MKTNTSKILQVCLLMIIANSMVCIVFGNTVAYAAAATNTVTPTSVASTSHEVTKATTQTHFTINSVSVTAITDSSATVSWQTSTISKSTIQYGTTQNAYRNTQTSPGSTTNHTVEITTLPPGRKIFYTIMAVSKDSQQQNHTGSFTTQQASKLSAYIAAGGAIIGTVMLVSVLIVLFKKRHPKPANESTVMASAIPPSPTPVTDTITSEPSPPLTSIDYSTTEAPPIQPDALAPAPAPATPELSVQPAPGPLSRLQSSLQQPLVRPQQPLLVRTPAQPQSISTSQPESPPPTQA